MANHKKYKVVNYGNYYAVSTWFNIKGQILASYDTIKEATLYLRKIEKE
tara:strand:+ start:24 stop:170 length:147 start_codon:yes stop_codon:yes gene_type:complete